jgi:hypothetical protein
VHTSSVQRLRHAALLRDHPLPLSRQMDAYQHRNRTGIAWLH